MCLQVLQLYIGGTGTCWCKNERTLARGGWRDYMICNVVSRVGFEHLLWRMQASANCSSMMPGWQVTWTPPGKFLQSPFRPSCAGDPLIWPSSFAHTSVMTRHPRSLLTSTSDVHPLPCLDSPHSIGLLISKWSMRASIRANAGLHVP